MSRASAVAIDFDKVRDLRDELLEVRRENRRLRVRVGESEAT